MEEKMVLARPERTVGEWKKTFADRAWEVRQRLALGAYQTFLDRMAVLGSISGADPAKLPLIADYSHWNNVIDLTLVKGFIKAVFLKACDGQQMYAGSSTDLGNYVDKTFHINVDKVYKLDVPCVPYIYVHWKTMADAGYKNLDIAKHHYKVLKQAIGTLIPGKSFHGVALDVEERNGTSPNVADIVITLFKLIADDPAFSGMPIFIYTSMSILNLYPNLRKQISWAGANYNGRPYYLWLAQWAWAAKPQITTTWQELHTKYVDPLVMRIITPGSAVCTILQFAANFKLPGCADNITDLSFFIGTPEGLIKLFRYTSHEVVVPPPDTNLQEVIARLKAVETTALATSLELQALKEVLRKV